MINLQYAKNKVNTMTKEEMIKEGLIFLFEKNNYTIPLKSLPFIIDKTEKLNRLSLIETLAIDEIVELTGKINIKLSQEISNSFLNTDCKNISYIEFKHLPFDCFRINMDYFRGVDSVVVYKETEKIYLQLKNINNTNVNINFIIDENNIILQETYSSLYQNKEISEIIEETYDVIDKCKDYILSILFYLVSFQNDNESIVKDMSYTNYISKHSPKKLEKPKFKKILMSKVNTVTLQLKSKPVSTNNTSYPKSTKEIQTTFLVRGHWRKQRVGTRDSYTTKRIWIRPFFKGVDTANMRNKIYKVA